MAGRSSFPPEEATFRTAMLATMPDVDTFLRIGANDLDRAAQRLMRPAQAR
ncbi:MAG: hypothetical protein ACHQ01_10560 [Candidatus Limnocylindrales bacterium]